MKILVPLNSLESLDPFVEAGAGEFYLGFYDPRWEEKFGPHSDINRMSGFGKRANAFSLEEIPGVVDRIRQTGTSGFITLNTSAYSQEHLDYLDGVLATLKEAGVDGVIVSTPELARLAKGHGIPIVASTLCNIYNRDIAGYYYDLGVRRMILPRELSLDQIGAISEAYPDVDIEVFIMRNGCKFSDSNCLGTHIIGTGAMCGMLGKAATAITLDKEDFETRRRFDENHRSYWDDYHVFACGHCALYRLGKMGVFSLKVVGRADDISSVVRDVRELKENIDIAENCRTEEEYLEKMKLPSRDLSVCKSGLSCYYPEVRFS